MSNVIRSAEVKFDEYKQMFVYENVVVECHEFDGSALDFFLENKISDMKIVEADVYNFFEVPENAFVVFYEINSPAWIIWAEEIPNFIDLYFVKASDVSNLFDRVTKEEFNRQVLEFRSSLANRLTSFEIDELVSERFKILRGNRFDPLKVTDLLIRGSGPLTFTALFTDGNYYDVVYTLADNDFSHCHYPVNLLNSSHYLVAIYDV